MTELFGLDLAAVLADALRGDLRSGTLYKRSPGARTDGSLTAGTNDAEAAHSFEGFVEDAVRRVPGAGLAYRSGRWLTVLGGSVSPAAEPAPGDRVVLDGEELRVQELAEVDPARATFVCRVARA